MLLFCFYDGIHMMSMEVKSHRERYLSASLDQNLTASGKYNYSFSLSLPLTLNLKLNPNSEGVPAPHLSEGGGG